MQVVPQLQSTSNTRAIFHTRPTSCRLPIPADTSFTSTNAQVLLGKAGYSRVRTRYSAVQPVAFKFLKQLGLKKPDFLPDFGLEKRKVALNRFYTSFDAATLNDVLSDNFSMSYRVEGPTNKYGKQDFIRLVTERVQPAIPDFNWSHATDGSKDKDGFCVVKVQATGNHSGKSFTVDDKLPPVKASGKKFLLSEETQLVCVEDGKISKIEVLPTKGAGPLALYEALGGKVPASARR